MVIMGDRIAVSELNGCQEQYTYDPLHRLTQEAITDPIAGNRTISYT